MNTSRATLFAIVLLTATGCTRHDEWDFVGPTPIMIKGQPIGTALLYTRPAASTATAPDAQAQWRVRLRFDLELQDVSVVALAASDVGSCAYPPRVVMQVHLATVTAGPLYDLGTMSGAYRDGYSGVLAVSARSPSARMGARFSGLYRATFRADGSASDSTSEGYIDGDGRISLGGTGSSFEPLSGTVADDGTLTAESSVRCLGRDIRRFVTPAGQPLAAQNDQLTGVLIDSTFVAGNPFALRSTRRYTVTLSRVNQ